MLDKNGHVVVALDEEYGYKYHLWVTGMTPDELEVWWSCVPAMMNYYMNPSVSLPGECLTVAGQDDMDYWRECLESGEFYTAHLHSEDDSCLATPDGRFVYHAGYVGPR